MKQIGLGFRCFLSAPGLLSATHTWRWVVAPGVLLMLGLIAMLLASWVWYLDFAGWLGNTLPEWAQSPLLAAILAAMLWISGFFLLLFLLLQFLMIAWAPVFGFVSEKIDAHLQGAIARTFSAKHLAQDLWRALRITVRSLFYWVLWVLISLGLLLIPVIGGPLSFFALLLTNGYFATLGLIDSCLERRQFSIDQTFDFARQHRMALLSIGLAFSLCLMIPIIGWILAPGLAVAAGTAYCVKVED
ncbi:MAG: EI24 domain-containing protein [Opitutales bacterium]|nr:EI24 domain-containing protein [Opitutales bacterium]NRA27625.1 EI24 domain-containing protein [Opitutales bacterium]